MPCINKIKLPSGIYTQPNLLLKNLNEEYVKIILSMKSGNLHTNEEFALKSLIVLQFYEKYKLSQGFPSDLLLNSFSPVIDLIPFEEKFVYGALSSNFCLNGSKKKELFELPPHDLIFGESIPTPVDFDLSNYYPLQFLVEDCQNPPVAAFIALNMLTALKYLHEKKIVHGELHTKNVVVGIDGTVKLCFGRKPHHGIPFWIAPELYLGGSCTEKVGRSKHQLSLE